MLLLDLSTLKVQKSKNQYWLINQSTKEMLPLLWADTTKQQPDQFQC